MKQFVCDICGAVCGSRFLRFYPRWIRSVMMMWLGERADICQRCIEQIKALPKEEK